ncbi:MAG TPA: hypothetical protein VIJ25_05950, partial [Methylococcales bacterium]
MAYRIEKQTSELVIDGWEKGIFASPFTGIANISGLNTSYYPGVAYVNYRRQPATITGGTMTNPVSKTVSPAGLIYIQDDSGQIWKQSVVNAFTFDLLTGGTGRFGIGNAGIAYWNNYLVVFGDGLIEFCGDGTDDSGIISTNWNINSTATGFLQNTAIVTGAGSGTYLPLAFPAYQIFIPKFQVNDIVRFTTTGTLPSPLALNTDYYITSFPTTTSVSVSATLGGTPITYTAAGTGVHTMTDQTLVLPIGNCTDLVVGGAIVPGTTISVT